MDSKGRDSLISSGDYVEDHRSILSLQPWIFKKESCRGAEQDMMKMNGDCSDRLFQFNRAGDASQVDLSPRSVSLGYGVGRGRSSLRSRRLRRSTVKPRTPVENCLIPQLYNQSFEIEEEYGLPAPRPLIITDGSRIISKSQYDPPGIPSDSLVYKVVEGISSRIKETVVGVPQLPALRVREQKSRRLQHRELEAFKSRRPHKTSHLRDSPDRMLLFCLGINIGVISTIISNRREVEKLNGMLKHTENLVQDLQDELDMKESLTVKELANENCDTQKLNGRCADMEESTDDSLGTQVLVSVIPEKETDDYDQLPLAKSLENSEFSKIEAELEAELERLELNMNTSSLEGRMSSLGELDRDLLADVVHGELRADILHGGAQGGQAADDRGSHSTSTTETHNANYVVSPRELSLRLHEVLQFQLKERIKELERELQHSQRQLQLVEAEQALSQSQTAFSNSELGSSSNQDSPMTMTQDDAFVQPLCLNLAGDALNAYDEAYEEFMRIADTQDGQPFTTNTGKQLGRDGSVLSDRTLEGSIEGKVSIDTSCFERETLSWEQIIRSGESNDADEFNDTDDEEGKMLIQQILERTRQGSPVLIHAQRMLFTMDE